MFLSNFFKFFNKFLTVIWHTSGQGQDKGKNEIKKCYLTMSIFIIVDKNLYFFGIKHVVIVTVS